MWNQRRIHCRFSPKLDKGEEGMHGPVWGTGGVTYAIWMVLARFSWCYKRVDDYIRRRMRSDLRPDFLPLRFYQMLSQPGVIKWATLHDMQYILRSSYEDVPVARQSQLAYSHHQHAIGQRAIKIDFNFVSANIIQSHNCKEPIEKGNELLTWLAYIPTLIRVQAAKECIIKNKGNG